MTPGHSAARIPVAVRAPPAGVRTAVSLQAWRHTGGRPTKLGPVMRMARLRTAASFPAGGTPRAGPPTLGPGHRSQAWTRKSPWTVRPCSSRPPASIDSDATNPNGSVRHAGPTPPCHFLAYVVGSLCVPEGRFRRDHPDPRARDARTRTGARVVGGDGKRPW